MQYIEAVIWVYLFKRFQIEHRPDLFQKLDRPLTRKDHRLLVATLL